MLHYYWLILLFPLLGFLLNSLGKRFIKPNHSGWIASIATLLSFIVVATIFIEQSTGNFASKTFNLLNWISIGNFQISFDFLIDPLSIIMMLVVTGVGALIHFYSIGYMKDDENIHTFFAQMNLFVLSMLILVMGANYLIMFVGWEGVGICSYFLIGFWYKNNSFNYAARKAFVMNRIGDLGFLIGMILMFFTFNSLSFSDIFTKLPGMAIGDKTITIITILLLIGALGKSAQIPLYTWLPDAMAGPTPVSALIHAATMVTAGVYMIARSGLLFIHAPVTMDLIVITGIATALLAASIGLFQNDIKKILAYSTISQLGFMFIGMGVGAFNASIFLLMTHAFFKALLFLGAGSIIHSLEGEQDIRKMGGLRKIMPITHLTFLIAVLAISGIPLFSGFFSKDEILNYAFGHNKLLSLLSLIGVMLTCAYMFRLYYLVFYNNYRGKELQPGHKHESPKVMTVPLIILALLSLVGGLVNIPANLGGNLLLDKYLSSTLPGMIAVITENNIISSLLIAVPLILVILVIWFMYNYFVQKQNIPSDDTIKRKGLANVLYNKYYIDEIYSTLFVKPYNLLSEKLYLYIEKGIIDKMINNTSEYTLWFSSKARNIQNGNISFYAFIMIVSVILAILINLLIK